MTESQQASVDEINRNLSRLRRLSDEFRKLRSEAAWRRTVTIDDAVYLIQYNLSDLIQELNNLPLDPTSGSLPQKPIVSRPPRARNGRRPTSRSSMA